ncbi:MAG TPA: hypothetical protein DCW31_11535 [Lactobacillus sp.]|nr:hypothetical protein [Lactobacillus sp.]
MEADDIMFQHDRQFFNVRASGMLMKDEKILFHCDNNEPTPYFALIGGKVKFGESSQDAIKREYDEEVGIEVKPERLLWVMEHQLLDSETQSTLQQVVFVYLLSSDEVNKLPDQRFTVGRHTFE